MFIKSVKINNFRGFQEAFFQFGENSFVLLAAPNGVGKTSVIDAIEWCLTGSIGRLKSSYDSRSTNDAERKINVNGILKYKNATSDEYTLVEICVKDGEKEHIILRSQKKDELGYSGKEVKVQVDGEEHRDGDWLSKCINQNFYNYHFCDIQKSLEIQMEKRASLAEMFREFITDYSNEELVADNLALFKKDTEKIISEKEKEKEKVWEQKSSDEEKIKEHETKIPFQEYPDTIMYEGETIELNGKDNEFLIEQREKIYTCGYSHVSDILKERIKNSENKKVCKKLDILIQKVKENKDTIEEAIKNDLDKDNSCITAIADKIKEYERIILNENSILEKGKILVEFRDDNFTEEYFEQKKKHIENLDEEIGNLEKDIKAVSDGNKIIETLTDLISKKQALLEYRDLRLKEGVGVKCPVCGSENFSELETQQILKEAADYLEVNEVSIKKKVEEKERKKQESDKLKNELISKGNSVLQIKIQKEKERKEKLFGLQESTKDFFAMQKSVSDALKDVNDISWWCVERNIASKKQMLEERQLSEKKLTEMKQEIKSIFDVMKCELEFPDTDQTVLNKISTRVAKAPKILMFTKELMIDKVNAISYRIQNQEITQLNKKIKTAEESIRKLDGEIHQFKELSEWAAEHEKKIRTFITDLIKQEYESVGPNLYKFYKKLSRINTIQNIKIIPDEAKNQVSLTDEMGNHVVNVLSNGQLSVFILAYFFAGIVSRKNNEKFKVYFIDDLTACMDDVNMLSFLDLLKYLLKEQDGPMDQLFFATCDDRIERLLCYKMKGCGIVVSKVSEAEFPKC